MKKYLRKNWLLILAIIIALLGVLNLIYKYSPQNNTQPNTPTTREYGDPDNYFTIQIPSNWKVNESNGTQKQGIGSARETTNKFELINISPYDGVGINIQAYEMTPSCENVEKPTTIIAGLPASFNDKQKSWTINTTTGIYIISYYYPGAGVFHRRFNTDITPILPSEMDANQRIIDTIISTLKLKNSTPLNC